MTPFVPPEREFNMTEPTGPLAGVRILDLTSVLFGPLGLQTLGDWGADIIKVESLTGDTWRYSGQARNRGMTGQFMAVNRNKRSLALDLKSPDGKAVLERRPDRRHSGDECPPRGAGAAFGLLRGLRETQSAADLRGRDGLRPGRPGPRARPSTKSFRPPRASPPQSGPTRSRRSFRVSSATRFGGVALAGAICAALYRRERSGKGQMVEVPMLETLAAFNSIEMFGGQAFIPPIGPNGYKRMKERKPVRTKDGWLTMLPYSGENWCSFFEAVGHPECIDEFEVRAIRCSGRPTSTRSTSGW